MITVTKISKPCQKWKLCKKIVELYGGSIWCEPGLDLGTVFYITLPVNPHKKSANIKENSFSKVEVEVISKQ